MSDYYVDSFNGNAANGGTSWADALDTLNNAEDLPVSAGDNVHCRGVFRETLVCDVSGSAGNPITYIGYISPDTGEMPRITGSDNDQSSVRAYNLQWGARNYRTFRSLRLDCGSTSGGFYQGINGIFEDCVFSENGNSGFYINAATQASLTIRRCLFMANQFTGLTFEHSSTVSDAGHVIENCIFVGAKSGGVVSNRVGGITVRNCVLLATYRGIHIGAALAGGQTITVNNSSLLNQVAAFNATVNGEITENFNGLWNNTTNYVNTAVGGNTVPYPSLLDMPTLIAGYQYSWWFGKLSQWSALASIAGTGVPSDDLFGITRAGSPSSWGPIEYTSSPARRDWDSGTSRGRRGT